MSKKNVDVIDLILKESKAYTSLEVIENFIQEQKSLANLPVQPLYTTFKSLPLEIKSHALSLLSKEQREVFYDLDLWQKDSLDIPAFSELVSTISKSPDEDLRYEFAKSSEFALFIKGRFNTWTFDVEDPLYPDHDYYFLTEDNLLLFEYDEDCEIVDEAKQLIRDIYSELGVEKAYQYIFTIVSDGFLSLAEDEYEKKKERLKHFGFVDYIEALGITSSFPSISHVDLFISKKDVIPAEIDDLERTQTLHANSLIAFEENELNITSELAKIDDNKRYDYLHFNFIRLVNANLEKNGAIKDGAMTMTRIGKVVRNRLELGFDYIKHIREFDQNESIFNYFDFIDVYRVGTSLLSLIQKSVKKELALFELDTVDDKFLGQYFEDVLDGLFSADIKVSSQGDFKPVVNVAQFSMLKEQSELIIDFLPFAMTFKKNLMSLISEGQINDDYYLNYSSESIDLEAILISLLINFSLDKINSDTPKMGVTIAELKSFHKTNFKDQKLVIPQVEILINEFITKFGLDKVSHFKAYFINVIESQMNDYEVDSLADHEFKHIGGPILFNNLS